MSFEDYKKRRDAAIGEIHVKDATFNSQLRMQKIADITLTDKLVTDMVDALKDAECKCALVHKNDARVASVEFEFPGNTRVLACSRCAALSAYNEVKSKLKGEG